MKFNKLHLTLFIILTIDAINFGLVLPVLPKLFLGDAALLVAPGTSLAMRYSLMGLVLSVYPMAVCIGTPLLSIASDRFGRKPIIFFSLVGNFFCLLFAAFALYQQSVQLLIVSRILMGIFSASQPIATAAIADVSRENNRPYYFSLVALSMTIGMLMGPLLGGFLSDKALWIGFTVYTPFIAAALFALANIMLMLMNYQETLPASVYKLKTFSQYITTCKDQMVQVSFFNLIIIFVLLEMAWSLFFQTEPVLLSNRFGYSSEMQSLYITFLGVVMAFGLAVLFKPLSKRMSLAKLAYAMFVFNLVGYIALSLLSQEIMRWFAPITACLGVGIGYTAIVSQLSLKVSQGQQGWLLGLTSALLALSWAVTGLIGPKLIALSANFPVMVCAALTIATLPFAYKILRSENKNEVSLTQANEA